jgi:DNA adenine methylase
MGSKGRHAKDIVPILLESHVEGTMYVEPFCGGGNMLSSIPLPNKWGNDTATYAVALLEAVSTGYVPPTEVSESLYREVKADPQSFDPALVGFLAYSCSYAGKFWGGFARGNTAKGDPRNIAREQVSALQEQAGGLVDTIFTCVSYTDLAIPDSSTVYCDPPYAGTTGYKDAFDHKEFWSWAKDLSSRCRVFVSEYSAPSWAKCVWEKRVTNSLTRENGSKAGVERLFRCHG